MSKGLQKLYHALQLFRELEEEIPTQTVVCFLLIANADEDIYMVDLYEPMGSSASTTRNVKHLSKQYKRTVRGLGLVEGYEDPNDLRYKRVRLTTKGKEFRARLNSIIG